MIEEVDLGPFKHKVDKGLPMRKSAYQLLETLLGCGSADHLNLNLLIETMNKSGLCDPAEEILVLSLNILAKLAHRNAVIVLSCIDQIMVSFSTLFDKHIKLVANKQESSINIVRALLRVVHNLNASPEVQESMPVSFKDFRDSKVLTNNDSRALFEKIISSSA